MKKMSYAVLGIAVAVAMSLIFAPSVSSTSANPCSQCHGSKYSQYLDLLESNSGNQIPTSIGVGETKSVSVGVENIVSSPRYTTLSSVTLSLSSLNGRFSVASPTFNLGSLAPGIKIATWQITGVSAGADTLLITARANNVHMQISFSDSFSPSPSISVTASAPAPPQPLPSYTVIVQASQDGTTSPVSGTYSRNSGSSITVTATPKTGYEFDRWIANGATMTANPLTLTITSDTTVTPVFRQQPQTPPPPPTSFTVTVQSSANGTTSPTAGIYSQTAGGSATFTATPKTGHKFDFWIVNGVAMMANPLTLAISSDTTVSPVFTLQAEPSPPAPISFTVIVKASPNGTTSPAAGNYSRGPGEVLALVASPKAGYMFDQWLINGMPQPANPFNLMVTENSTVLPEFKLTHIQQTDPATPPALNQTSPSYTNQTSSTNQSSKPNPVNNLAISFLSPAENAKWRVGTTQNIEWNVSGNAALFNITLEYSTAGFDGPWITIGSNITYIGHLVWTAPSTPATYYFRAMAFDSADPAQVALATSLVEISETAPSAASNNFVVPIVIVLVTLVPGVLVPVVRNSKVGNRRIGKQILVRAD